MSYGRILSVSLSLQPWILWRDRCYSAQMSKNLSRNLRKQQGVGFYRVASRDQSDPAI